LLEVNDVSAPEAVAAEERHGMIEDVKNVHSVERTGDGGRKTDNGGLKKPAVSCPRSPVFGHRSSVCLSPRSAVCLSREQGAAN
jgi:hypothetical protein